MSDRSKKANEKRAQLWKHHLEEWSRSGLTQVGYCRENHLRPNRLTYWKNKFKKQNLPVEFVQVPQVNITTATSSQFRDMLRLNVDSGFQIEIPDGFSQDTLNRVLHVLRQF